MAGLIGQSRGWGTVAIDLLRARLEDDKVADEIIARIFRLRHGRYPCRAPRSGIRYRYDRLTEIGFKQARLLGAYFDCAASIRRGLHGHVAGKLKQPGIFEAIPSSDRIWRTKPSGWTNIIRRP